MARESDGNDYVDFNPPTDIDVADVFSVAMWVKPINLASDSSYYTVFHTQDTLFGGYENWGIESYLRNTGSGNKLLFRLSYGNNQSSILTSNTSLPNNTWHYIVLWYDNSLSSANMRLYINSVRDDNTMDFSETVNTADKHWQFHAHYNGVGYSGFLKGIIGAVRAWDKALTLQEIKNNMWYRGLKDSNVIFDAPMMGKDVYDTVQQFSATVDGTTLSDDPPITGVL